MEIRSTSAVNPVHSVFATAMTRLNREMVRSVYYPYVIYL